MDDQLHVEGASPSLKPDAIAPEGVEQEESEEGKEDQDPFTIALERLSKTGKKAKQIAERANSGVMELQKSLTAIAEKLERVEKTGLGKKDDDEEEVESDDGNKYRKSDIENLKKVAKLAGLTGGVSEKRMERIEKLLEENEIDRRLEDAAPSEKKLIKEILRTRIARSDDLEEDIQLARGMAKVLATEFADEEELKHASSVAGAASAPVSGRRLTVRPRLNEIERGFVSALKEAFPDRKINWEEKFTAIKE